MTTPTKAATYDYIYEFAGWDPEITEDSVVTGDVTYTAIPKHALTITYVLSSATRAAAIIVTTQS